MASGFACIDLGCAGRGWEGVDCDRTGWPGTFAIDDAGFGAGAFGCPATGFIGGGCLAVGAALARGGGGLD